MPFFCCFSVLQKPGPLSKRKPEFRHPCVSCEKRFLTITGLKQHMESAHPQSLQDFVPIPDVPDIKSNTSGNILVYLTTSSDVFTSVNS